MRLLCAALTRPISERCVTRLLHGQSRRFRRLAADAHRDWGAAYCDGGGHYGVDLVESGETRRQAAKQNLRLLPADVDYGSVLRGGQRRGRGRFAARRLIVY